MAAIIPDDWDGLTYECKRVIWPSSKKWAAILLGQLTEPSVIEYWDASTGDEEEAFYAVQKAYRQTIPDIYNEECGDLPPLIPRVAFKAVLSNEQTIPSTTWTQVKFDTLEYSLNSPGFNTTFFWHTPDNVDLEGLWVYTVQISAPVNPIAVRINHADSPPYLARQAGAEGFAQVAFHHVHSAGELDISAEVWLPSGAALNEEPDVTYFFGVFLGPVV